MGEFLINAQGEDVVAGVRTPMPIAQMEQEFPEAYAEFIKAVSYTHLDVYKRQECGCRLIYTGISAGH